MKRNHSLSTAVFCLVFLFSGNLHAQLFERWAEIVKWDGVSSWRNYMIYSPRFMGANALPVPTISNGTADSVNQFSVLHVFHFRHGDYTHNLKISANYCFIKERVSFDINWIPVEWFTVTDRVKEERHVYHIEYYAKKARGDIYCNVTFQLLNKWRKNFHLAFRAGYRYATSSAVAAARFTDAPGYHFDLSAAKPLQEGRFKLTAMLGLYIWQLNIEGQDDAMLYGGGFEYNHNNWRIVTSCRGYSGYRNNGDRPLLINSSIEKRNKRLSFLLNLQQGLHDYRYTSIETGIKYHFKTR
jgi:hypothetical protein